ncbi:MAG: phenylalanine--tRNA ligase subunit beta [Caldimonas sp.]
MQFPESWLREFCDPPLASAELADRLTMAGFEVESMRPVAPPFSGVVVGRVLAVADHPNADRLRVCQVDIGESGPGEPLAIVCGAPNVRVGIKVPCAVLGAVLPPAEEGATEPFRIKTGKIRGVESQGMLCSARELKLSDDHGGLLVLDESAPVGEDVRRVLGLDDTIFTLKLTPNLGHGLSVYGVAREVAALTGAPLRPPAFSPVAVTDPSTLPVTIEAADLCGRFSGRIIRGVDPAAKTPAWLVERLARCGQRAVSPLVDISNYVMFELGRPTHIFDLDRIDGGLTVRWGRAGETLELLNGTTVELDAEVGVIADARSVESLAGIMGGAATAVSDATRNVYVEAAFWWPEAVAGRSRRFHFSTDAGHRFERGVDPASTVEHIERITALIVEICGGDETRCGPIDDQVTRLPARTPVPMRVARAAKVIGMPLTQTDCEAVFARLGLPFSSGDGVVEVTPPSWRFDLALEEDLIEEVIRLVGYDALPALPPLGTLVARAPAEAVRGPALLRRQMADLGYRETISYSFIDERMEHELAGNADPIRVLNPIAADRSVMRSTLLGSLVDVLRSNLARKAGDVRVFEIGKVYFRDPAATDGPATVAGVAQPLRLAGLAYGGASPLHWSGGERTVDFFDVKGDLQTLLAPAVAEFAAASHPALHPGRSATVSIGGQPVGVIGELHPRWRQRFELPGAPIVFELDAAALMARMLPAFEPLPRQQPSWRDIALVADRAVTHAALMAAIASEPGGVLRSARLFDVYEPKAGSGDFGPGEHGLAVRLEFRADGDPLTDERIDAARAGVLSALSGIGVRLRQQ